MKTILCERLGIELPIIQAPMGGAVGRSRACGDRKQCRWAWHAGSLACGPRDGALTDSRDASPDAAAVRRQSGP